ncbi:hypothetical protein [Erythrobacter rubeus]|uniref:Uncharacterized protein n=1 Tax=Erythrobacter rubeus TaxID=2760803 RepID=A0ABR8KSW5_9SPHN|nr:hypothetical protein [Erythrobacter rubeus]MBD2842685.1 hypothetical protein [Erythrobacter rubeus]
MGSGGIATKETYSIRLAVAVEVDALDAWFAEAKPGERERYAEGFELPRDAPSVKRARELAQAQAAHLLTQRHADDPRRTTWLIEKRGRPRSQGDARKGRGPTPPQNPGPRPDLTREQMRSLLNRLRKAAHDGEPCPSRTALAQYLALGKARRGRDRIGYLLKRLEREGAIELIAGDATRPPVVTILKAGRARGKSTKGER